MSHEQFAGLADLLPEALIAISADGLILAANQRVAVLLGCPSEEVIGRRLAEICTTPTNDLDAYLRTCSRTRERTIGSMIIHGADQTIECRTEGFLLKPRERGKPAEIALRFLPKESTTAKFVLLNERIDQLSREIHARVTAEHSMREQHELLRVTLGSIGDAVIATDHMGRITFQNAVASSLTGWGDEALDRDLGEVFQIVNEQTHEAVENPVNKVLREGKVFGLANHTTLIAKDGVRHPIDDSGAPIRAADGRIIGVVLVFRDVSARIRHEADLRNREAIYRSTVDDNPALICHFKADGTLTFVNNTYCQTFQRPPEQLVGTRFTAAVPEEDQSLIHRMLATLHPNMSPYSHEHRVILSNGEIRWQQWTNKAVVDSEGKFVQYQAVGIDLTDRKRAELSLKASAGRQRFLADLANATQALINPDDIMRSSAQLLAEHLEVDRCAYAEVESESVFVITGDYAPAVRSIVGRWAVADFGTECRRLMLANEPFIVCDVDEDLRIADSDIPAYRATDIQAVICVPLYKAGQFTAAMAVHQTIARNWTADEVALVTTVVSRCWEALERARVIKTLRESEERFRTLANSVPVHIWLDDEHGQVNFANARILEFSGHEPEELPPDFWKTLIHPDDYQKYLDSRRSGTTSYEASRAEVRLRGNDGSYRWFEVLSSPRFEGERFAGNVGISLDITDRKEAQEQLQLAAQRKDEFLATLAHELRNPLAPLRSGLEVIKLVSDGTGTIEEIRSMMERQLTHMVRLVDDLLDISRISRGKLELRKERIALAEVLQNALEASQSFISQAGHELKVDVIDEPIYVNADKTRLAQAISNLLINAAKYTDPGGTVTLIVRKQNNELLISVKDSGVGIPAEMLTQVFDMFTQVDRTLEKTHGGLGIGLSIVRRLAELHGGRVEGYSEGLGAGSEFILTLPMIENDASETGKSQISNANHPQSLKILVVDDNRDAASMMRMIFLAMGNEVRVAHDGIEGIEAAESFRPDIIFLDIGMPRLNGYDACRRIRGEAWANNIVFVAVTGWGQDDDRRRAQEAGFDHHLVKPAEPARLRQLLSTIRQTS